MPEKVKGLDASFKFNLNGSLEVYCYAKSFDMDIQVETIGVSTLGSGNAKEFIPKRWGWTMTMDALVLLADTLPKNTTPQMVEQMLNFVITPVEILYYGENGSVYSRSGRAFFQGMTFSHTPNGFVSKNVTLQGSGGLLRGTTPVSMVNLLMQVVSSPGTISMSNIKIVDAIGNETVVHAGTITNGTSVTASIPAGTYHIRATLNSDRAYNLFYSDADPGFAVHLDGAQSGTVYWPYPPNSPVFDFTVNRYLKWQGSDTPLA
jgi:hypothetical protein